MVVSAFVHILALFANAVFPVSMIILGANVAQTLRASMNAGNDTEQGLSRKEKLKKFLNPIYILKFIRRKFIAFNNPVGLLIGLFIKLAVMPLLGVGLVYLGTDVLKVIPQDPIMILTILIEWS